MSILRVRFHGRGGQGMKTASRILGSAAFHAGFEVQDSPVYGAERRGAPIAAFVRLAREPILERGAIESPHLVVISDDTLLDDASAGTLAGTDESTVLIVDTTRDLESFKGKRVAADFTSLALEVTEVLPSLSTALSAAAARVLGLSVEDCLEGVRAELAHSLGAEILERNVRLAERVFALGDAWPRLDVNRVSDIPRPVTPITEMRLDPPRRAAPSIYAPANTPERHTGNWRQYRPELEKEKCNRCWLCFVWCPEAAIALDDEEYPAIDYDVCKGCLLCAHECPTQAFRVEREVRA